MSTFQLRAPTRKSPSSPWMSRQISAQSPEFHLELWTYRPPRVHSLVSAKPLSFWTTNSTQTPRTRRKYKNNPSVPTKKTRRWSIRTLKAKSHSKTARWMELCTSSWNHLIRVKIEHLQRSQYKIPIRPLFLVKIRRLRSSTSTDKSKTNWRHWMLAQEQLILRCRTAAQRTRMEKESTRNVTGPNKK